MHMTRFEAHPLPHPHVNVMYSDTKSIFFKRISVILDILLIYFILSELYTVQESACQCSEVDHSSNKHHSLIDT